MSSKKDMIAYIVKLLEAASPEAVRKMFICACNICESREEQQ